MAATRDLFPPFIIRIYDRLDRFTNGSEVDEMLADILFIYALMGAIEIDEMWADMLCLYMHSWVLYRLSQAASLTIHLINP